ncbi:MAG: phage/plasmid primase, P4 family, partial [Planktothrix sp.]
MNENLSDYILRQQRGYEYTPTPGITPEQLNSFSGKNRTSKRNLCPVCGNNHGCQILDDDAVNCLRTKENNVPPGWKVTKDLGGLGSTVVREREQTEEEKQQQREQWQRQQEERKIREQERKAVGLTDEQIDSEARKIFKQLGLTTKHRQALINRGLTDEQIDLIGFKTVDKFQELKLISVNPNFPGIINGKLSNKNSGFLIPIRSQKGLIIGFQVANDNRNPKYQWFFGSSERRVSGELPLQFLKVNDSKELNVIEGTLKPLVAAHLHNINVLGDGGCRWSSSPEELQTIIDSNQFDSYILNPDTGSLLNDNVMAGYTAFYLFLKSRDIALYVRDWGQGEKPKSDKIDIDEISTETFKNAEIKTFEEWVGMDTITTPNTIINQQDENVLPLWNQGDISEYLADKYRENLAWNIEAQEWYRYGAQYNGIWSVEPIECIKQVINAELKGLAAIYNQSISNPEQFKKISYQLISSIEKLMVCELGQKKWDFDNKELIPFKNGVLNFKTHKFTEHCPGNRLTWCLPYDYNLMADCQPIKDWMLEMFGSSEMVEFVRAYLNAIVTSRTDLQSYLELIGPGGTGKSTVIRLAQALVGVQNCHTTSLEKLEKDKFEPANIYGKKLIIISDSERYGGGVSMLKAITGGDSIPFEMKFKQARGGFTPSVMVLVAANELPQSNDYTSGLSRRRLTVTMNKQIDVLNRRDLIEINGESIKGDFAPYIPGLVNWVLAVPTDHVTNTIKGYSTLATVKASKAEILTETNPIAAWVNYCIIYEKESKTYVGAAMPDKSPDS